MVNIKREDVKKQFVDCFDCYESVEKDSLSEYYFDDELRPPYGIRLANVEVLSAEYDVAYDEDADKVSITGEVSIRYSVILVKHWSGGYGEDYDSGEDELTDGSDKDRALLKFELIGWKRSYPTGVFDSEGDVEDFNIQVINN